MNVYKDMTIVQVQVELKRAKTFAHTFDLFFVIVVVFEGKKVYSFTIDNIADYGMILINQMCIPITQYLNEEFFELTRETL